MAEYAVSSLQNGRYGMKKTLFIFAIIISLLPLSSCASDNGKSRLCELLFSDGYGAEFDFTISDGTAQKLSGSAVAIKDGKTTLSFTSPDALSGLTVTSDASGNADSLTFNYYGMKMPLPSGSLSAVNGMVSFFSDENAIKLASLKRDASKPYNEGGFDESVTPRYLDLSGDGADIIIYDAATGDPLRYVSRYDGGEITLAFTKIKRPTSKGTETE